MSDADALNKPPPLLASESETQAAAEPKGDAIPAALTQIEIDRKRIASSIKRSDSGAGDAHKQSFDALNKEIVSGLALGDALVAGISARRSRKAFDAATVAEFARRYADYADMLLEFGAAATTARMRRELETDLEWRTDVFMRAIAVFGRNARTPTLVGIIVSLIVIAGIAPALIMAINLTHHWVADSFAISDAAANGVGAANGDVAPNGVGAANGEDAQALFPPFRIRGDIIHLMGGALLGALASMMTSLARTNSQRIYSPATVFSRAFMKPIIAMIFALALYLAILGGYLSVGGLDPLSASDGAAKNNGYSFSKLEATIILIGFLSGFTERFVPNLFDRRIKAAPEAETEQTPQ